MSSGHRRGAMRIDIPATNEIFDHGDWPSAAASFGCERLAASCPLFLFQPLHCKRTHALHKKESARDPSPFSTRRLSHCKKT